MASSNTEIANIAISHLGVGKEIADLDTENSQEANACRRYYDTALDYTLREWPWPFATKFATLSLVEENPNDEWSFSYRYPGDALMIKRVLSGVRNDNRQTRVAYKIASDDDGTLIYCDLEDAEIEYTSRSIAIQFYPNDFVMAFAWRLAFYIAPRITGGDPFKLRQTCLQMYDFEVTRAKANSANEEQPDEEPESEFVRSRD